MAEPTHNFTSKVQDGHSQVVFGMILLESFEFIWFLEVSFSSSRNPRLPSEQLARKGVGRSVS